MAKYYSVITGDIVGSSKILKDLRNQLITTLKDSFLLIEKAEPDWMKSKFEMFRGDGFQAIITKPEHSLMVALMIRLSLRSENFKVKANIWEARIAIGIGTIDFLSQSGSPSESDGDAFRNSGPVLDQMKGDERLKIKSPWGILDEDINVEFGLLDALINHWTPLQSESVLKQLMGLGQEEMAREQGISQPAINKRLKSAGANAIEKYLKHFESKIKNRIVEEN